MVSMPGVRVKIVDELAGRSIMASLQPDAPGKRGPVVGVQDKVVGHRKQRRPSCWRSSGIGGAVLDDLARRRVGAHRRRCAPGLQCSTAPVRASTARFGRCPARRPDHDLAGRPQRDLLDGRWWRSSSTSSRQPRAGSPGQAGAFPPPRTARPTIMAAGLFAVSTGVMRPHAPAGTTMRSAAPSPRWLVADKDDKACRYPQTADDGEWEVEHLLRREHGRRLVEDEHIGMR